MSRFYFIIAFILLASCDRSESRIAIDRISVQNDPATLSLEKGFNSYVQCTLLKDYTETGIIQMEDGTTAKYWFRSHHLTNDDSTALFEMSDGTRSFMSGYFCCEVQLPEKQIASLDALREFILQNDGVAP